MYKQLLVFAKQDVKWQYMQWEGPHRGGPGSVKLTVSLQWLAPILMLHTLHGAIGRWVYLMRTVDVSASIFQPTIHNWYFPALTGQTSSSPEVRKLLSLPTCLCGLNIVNPVEMLQWQFKASQTMTIPAKIMIAEQSEQFAKPQLQPIKSNLRRERSQAIAAKVDQLKEDQIVSREEWIWPAKKELLHGWPRCHCRRGVSTSTSRNFRTLLWLTIEEPPWLGRFFNATNQYF